MAAAALLLGLSGAWVIIVSYLIAHAVRQYAAYEKISASSISPENQPPACVVIPARNEQANIARCLGSMLSQNYPAGKLRVIAVNDSSTDATESIIRRIAADHPALTLLQGSPLPKDWKGKPFACWQAVLMIDRPSPSPGIPGEGRGGDRAIESLNHRSTGSLVQCSDDSRAQSSPKWLCFVDADTTSEPMMLASAIGLAERRGIDMLSLEPFQILHFFWDRLIIPAGFFLAAFSMDLRRVNNPACPEAFANGQCILIRKSVYDAIGGHAAVRDAISEDSALARVVKSAGYRLMVLGGESLISTRMYQNFTGLWEGVAKNLVDMIGSRRRTLFFAIVAMVLATASVALPACAWTMLAHHYSPALLCAAILATAGSLAMLGVHIGGAVYFKIPFVYGLLFPIAYIIGAVLALDSLRRHYCDAVPWKGRMYTTPRMKDEIKG